MSYCSTLCGADRVKEAVMRYCSTFCGADRVKTDHMAFGGCIIACVY
jgi:hypothetical protein